MLSIYSVLQLRVFSINYFERVNDTIGLHVFMELAPGAFYMTLYITVYSE